MPIDVTMPRLSDTMESGTIIKWNVKEGDEVSAGDVIADVETDKATMEMQVFDDGVVARINVDEGQTVDIGTVIAVLAGEDEDVEDVRSSAASNGAARATPASEDGDDDEQDDREERSSEADAEARPRRDAPARATAEAPRDGASASRGGAEAAEARPSIVTASAPDGDGRMRISPVAQRLADDHGIDPRSLSGSGPGGRIIKRDVLQAVEAGAETAASVPPSARSGGVPVTAVRDAGAGLPTALRSEMLPLSSMRQTIARRLVESKQTIPHYQVTVTFAMDELLDLRRAMNERLETQGVKLSVNDFLVRACALALHEHPQVNASWAGDHLELHGEVNVGMAVALPPERGGGLVVATIRRPDRRPLREISAEARLLAEKARTRGLSAEEMADTTFTISNLGMFGVEHFTAIINPPNSAILAVGAAVEKPVVRDGALAVGREMSATMSSDHRVIDGAMAAQFLQTLKALIESPATLLV